ncbi:MAG: poly[(R)-3-hydroxyalkanoate] polymerase subunit PhaC [Solirubrobacteraceae bacterium]|jgi:polyhydroxyalkanoate synthase|nr:poly[(R)-3-hydroxyalkanoate] polymerase subunit PhaC [Solirubrobacteraceae bacterium]MEA2242153.1 poly[(R)-3-hydroxyalkanoate] polymerase subunit PhaC [Solirubrobacteraceae bacterium]
MEAKRRTGVRVAAATQANGRGEAQIAEPSVGDVGLDGVLSQIGRRRLRPGPEAGRLLLSLARRPVKVANRGSSLAVGLAQVVAGSSRREPQKGDRRFSDPAWEESWLFRRLVQGYLAIADEARGLVDDAELDWTHDQQVRIVVDNLIDALAPTNFPLSNPTALKATIDRGGENFVVGARQFAKDMSASPRIPANNDRTAFVVGETVACTPGAVVARRPKYELLQYQPVTEEVREVPVIFIPPMISKFYCVDLSPGRSLIEYLVAHGQQTFTMSWKNATKNEAHWDFDSYMEAIIEALKTTAEVCSTDRVHVAGLCLGGIMSTCAVSHLAQTGEQDLIAGLTLNVTVLDNERAGPVLALTSPASAAVAKAKSNRQGYLAGTELATTFAWLRPNEMIWNNVVNNYLLGKKPPAFDLLYWNGDSQNMPAAAHRDLVQFGLDNPLARPGAVTVLGTPIDLSKITADAYAVGAETDHLTPWGHCYRTVNLLGGDTRFVLSSSGHIAAIINPPGNPRARYHVADEHPADAEEWLAAAEKKPGTWWDDWVAWLAERSGPLKAAPQKLGNRKHKVLGPAPGAYVLERSPK